ncbi:hypothetical protein [Oceanobacter mangrovi]|uniref:hypothetical protein n=1 Tax=Oceanobacter mangrovi TaxID=2862510 RepID=UPI001C8D6D08|nr:hypothetical protein [Oceanobacter mangrovi]
MSYSTVKDILNLAQKLHHQASILFDQLRDSTQKERVDMVMKLLATHEEQQSLALQRVASDVRESVMNEWHQLEPADLADILEDCQACQPDMSAEELVNVALKINDYLISLYKGMAAEAGSDASRTLFEGLADLENHQKQVTVRSALSVSDW